MNNPAISPTNQGTPSVTEAMIEAGAKAFLRGGPAVLDAAAYTRIYLTMQSAAPQHTGPTPKATCAYCSAEYSTFEEAKACGLTDVERVKAAMKSHEVVGVAFPDSCCTVYRVQMVGTPTVIGGDHASAEDAQVACDELNARAALAAMQQPVCADAKRLLREARSYVEQAGLRHHDVSGLLAEIDAVLRSRSNQVMEDGDNG